MHSDSYSRGAALLERMVEKSTVVLRQLANDFAEERGFHRFLHNERVSIDDVLSVYRPAIRSDIETQHVLILQDTTKMNFGLNSSKTANSKGKDKTAMQFFAHPAIALNAADGGCLGLGAVEVYQETPYLPTADEQAKAEQSLLKSLAKKAQQLGVDGTTKLELPSQTAILARARKTHADQLPFESKNRYRWLTTALSAADYYKQAAKRTVIADSEGDIYQVFSGLQVQNVDFVIRSCQDRYVHESVDASDMQDASGQIAVTTLRSQARQWAVQCCYQVALPATDKRSAHTANLQVSYHKVTVACPKHLMEDEAKKAKKNDNKAQSDENTPIPPSMTMYAVYVREAPESVVNNEAPIDWLLLTSHPVENCEQALEIIQFYRWRWVIEQIFRTMKSQGLDIQKSTIDKYEGCVKLAILALIAATQILQFVQARDGKTDQTIQEVFDDIEIQAIEQISTQLEGRTQKQKNPHPPQSLAFAVWVIARLGGWKPDASPRPPGPITILNGFVIFHNMMIGVKLKIEPRCQRTL
jgi:hypothetical protein